LFAAVFRFLDQGNIQVSSLMIGVGWPLQEEPDHCTGYSSTGSTAVRVTTDSAAHPPAIVPAWLGRTSS
jgi:hypothetical protein